MRVTCPHCSRGLTTANSNSPAMKCPQCGGVFTIPQPTIDPLPESAPEDLSLAFDTNTSSEPTPRFARESRKPRERERPANSAKRTFYLILGIFIFLLVGSGLSYLFLVELPDQKYDRMWDEKKKLFEDLRDKAMVNWGAKKPNMTSSLEVEKAKQAYITKIREMIDFCREHRYLPRQSERMKKLEEELKTARELG